MERTQVEKQDMSRIIITGRTLQANGQVFPIRNICMFGPGMELKYPWARARYMLLAIIVCFSIFSFTLLVTSIAADWGGFMIVIALIFWLFLILTAVGSAALIYLVYTKPVWHGLRITLNSGQSRFYPTSDESGVKKVSDWITKLLEGAEVGHQANVVVNRNSVTITQSTVSGTVAGGDSAVNMRTGGRNE